MLEITYVNLYRLFINQKNIKYSIEALKKSETKQQNLTYKPI